MISTIKTHALHDQIFILSTVEESRMSRAANSLHNQLFLIIRRKYISKKISKLKPRPKKILARAGRIFFWADF